jgi:hypothetical protein
MTITKLEIVNIDRTDIIRDYDKIRVLLLNHWEWRPCASLLYRSTGYHSREDTSGGF